MEKIINVFGDSIAKGHSAEGQNGWVSKLKEYLEEEHQDYFEVYNLGISGNTTDDLLGRFSNENKSRNPNIVIVAIGINDSQYVNTKETYRVGFEKFENNLLEIIKQGKEYTQEIVFVGLVKIEEEKLMPIPWNTAIYGEEKDAIRYNKKIKEICEKNNLPFIDMDGLLENDDLEDGLHPITQGHEKMFQRIKDFLIKNKII